MMLGIEDYGSGSDNGSDNESPAPKPAPVKVPMHSAKSSISLPPPSTPTAKVQLPHAKTKRNTKKITIGLPTFSTPQDEEDDDLDDERPSAKRLRLTSGAGASSLLTMLPAPKQKKPTLPAPERVLGGGKGPGLVFRTPQPPASLEDDSDVHDDLTQEAPYVPSEKAPSPVPQDSTVPLPFLPPSLKKGRPNISVEDEKSKQRPQPTKKTVPALDFFSLGNASSKPTMPSTSNPSSSIPQLSSAPVIPIFEPPEPSQTDEYPGYYQLPSGAWAAHDPAYFAKFVKKWQTDYNAQVRALEKGMVKGFEGLETAAVEEVNAMKEMEKAKLEMRDREERKAVTQGADGGPVAPKMNINASKTSGVARSRHQLSTLLKEAFENREALEERIAQGKRNRKEAGNKYGF